MDVKLSKSQLSKMIQSVEYRGGLLGKLSDPVMKVAVPLSR